MRYVDIELLQPLIDEYNGTHHRTIKMKPNDVNYSDEKYLLDTVYRLKTSAKKYNGKFKVGSFVRISKYKHIFEKVFITN